MSDQDASRRVGISNVSVSASSISMLDSMHGNFTSSSNLIPDSGTRSEPSDPFATTGVLTPTSRAPSPHPTLHAAAMLTAPAVSTEVPSAASSLKPGPALAITLLLTSGKRLPYKIDEKYLTLRNIMMPGVTKEGTKDPYSISVYTLKELILREWREEWEAQPSSPSSIRLIYFGRLLEDNTPLLNYRFSRESSNIIHMTVRPQEIVDEEDGSKSKALARDRENGETTAGCRCAIM